MFEDDDYIEDIYFQKLTQFGFEVKSYKNYPDVVKLVVEEEPDILLIDILVPGEIDGFEAIKLLKKDLRTSEIPVVIVSNIDNQECINRGLNLGAVNYLVKALYTPNELATYFMKHLIEVGSFTKEDFKNN